MYQRRAPPPWVQAADHGWSALKVGMHKLAQNTHQQHATCARVMGGDAHGPGKPCGGVWCGGVCRDTHTHTQQHPTCAHLCHPTQVRHSHAGEQAHCRGKQRLRGRGMVVAAVQHSVHNVCVCLWGQQEE